MPPESSPEPSSIGVVLVVEDDVMVRTVTCEALRDAGLRVIEASTADEAWAYLASNSSVDVIFSDIHMPGLMNGEELAVKVKRKYHHIPIILTSGAASEKTNQRYFIRKPYRLGDVVKAIIDALN